VRLPDFGEGKEFWTRSGALKIERVRGEERDAVGAMQRFCRTVTPTTPSRPASKAEARFVTQLAEQTPLEESGAMALYQPRDQRSMVVAVDRPTSRIVG